jgi:hypothetical protein
MSYPIPMVRLTVEHMQHEIMQALNVHSAEMKDAIEEEVALVIQNFDWRSDVGRLARDAINQAIKREVEAFFARSGPGGRAIRDAIADKLDKDGSWNV